MNRTTETLLTGAAIAAVLEDLATLRLEIFLDYPYLYRGERAQELAYLRSYAEQPETCVLIARDGGKVVGAATGMPLEHENAELKGAFAGNNLPIETIFYIGELLFLPGYRGQGLGQRLLSGLENRVRALGRYRQLTCATVERPEDHPQRPADDIPITRFLARTGFQKLPGVTVSFNWRETDGVRRDHLMQFWVKPLGL